MLFLFGLQGKSSNLRPLDFFLQLWFGTKSSEQEKYRWQKLQMQFV